MILKHYYEQKKQQILAVVNKGLSSKDAIELGLFNDLVFKPKSKATFPLIMFKYNDIIWNTSSENEYKADVNFSVFIVLNTSFEKDYIESFDLAQKIDTAILLHPTQSEIRQNKEDLIAEKTEISLITNSAFKIREGQYTVEDDNWEKSEYFIWEINYKTTLIERAYKKRYTMVANNAFVKADLNTEAKKEEVKNSLKKLGYNLDDYYETRISRKKISCL